MGVKIKIGKYIWLAAFCCLACIVVVKGQQKPIADFSANIVSGCSPLVVQFTDLSANTPTQWNWDLGNGNTSNQKNPVATYFLPGTYSIRLIAINNFGADTLIKQSFITVYDNPTVSFLANKTTGCYPLNVQFSNSSLPNSGNVVDYLWDFGDGNTSTQINPQHIYTVAGNFTVTLKVTNTFGCSKILNIPNYINITGGVNADFTVNNASGCSLPASISFANNSQGTGAITYLWDFGDGTFSNQISPTHAYTNAGVYTVTLIATSTGGCNDTLRKVNAVSVGTVSAGFSYNGQCKGSAVRFQNTSTPTPASVRWTFSDGTSTTQLNPIKIFNSIGPIQVKMVADFGACKDSSIQMINILDKPKSGFSNTPKGACLAPLNVQFTDTSTNGAINYQWSFGDGGTSTLQNPSYTYNAQGVYTVTLVTTNTSGCTDTLRKPDAVIIKPPEITGFSSGVPYEGCAPYSNVFSATVVSQDPITTYQWNFGDATPLQFGEFVNHTYTNLGFYNITLIVFTANGCSDTLVAGNGIKLYAKPQANFSATPRVGCAQDDITFTNLSSSNVSNWYWQFGDGGSSTAENPIYNYVDTGFFSVTLIVANQACKDTLRVRDYIYINPPIAKFQKITSCDTPLQRRFIDQSIEALTYAWDFGDGNTSTIPNPVHTYAATGIYVVKLTVTNGGCTHFVIDTVGIAVSNPQLAINGNTFCKYALVNMRVLNVDTNQIANYIWSFGDGQTLTGRSLSNVNYRYTRSGNFTPSVTVIDKLGCTYNLNQPTPIIIYGPKAGFSNPAGTCINGTINFTDTSTTDGVHAIQQWIWNYGDGKSDTLTSPPFTHQYTSAGAFTVKLTITDAFGCADTLVKPSAVLITKPLAAFSSPDTIRCIGKPVSFSNTSTGNSLLYNWTFGDNTTSTIRNPQHSYTSAGLYNISLKVTDVFGCTDSIMKLQYIKVADAVASFRFLQGDSIGLCYPFLIEVMSTSINTDSVSWSFGTGGFSNLNTPTHFYNYVGTYPLVLKAYGFGGCVDSVKTNITVRGPTGTFTYAPTSFCNPANVTFTATTLNNASFIWDFGDGVVQTTTTNVVTHPYLITGSFKPKMILVDAAGCTVPITGADTIKVAGVFTKIKVPQTHFCDSVRLQFLDSTTSVNDVPTSFLWNFGDGNTSTNRTPNHFYNQPGNYIVTLKVSTSIGCTYTDTLAVPIAIKQTPKVKIEGDSVGCVNTLLQYIGTIVQSDTATINWRWTLGNSTTSTLQNPPAQFYTAANTYFISVVATSNNGCADTIRKPIIIHPTPIINAGLDTFVCLTKSVVLRPTGGINYVWSTNSTLSCTTCTNPIATPTLLTEYKVTGFNNFGCQSSDSVFVNVLRPFNISASINDTLCVGEKAQLTVTDGYNYTWSPAATLSSSSIRNPVASPTNTTVYTVVARDAKNCFTDTAAVTIFVYPIPQFNIIPPIIRANTGTVMPIQTSNSTDVIQWRWLPVQGLSCTNCATPNVTVSMPIKYVAEATNAGGCKSKDEVTIEPLCNGLNLFIPNTFSPNGDRVNDVFYPRGKGIFSIKSIRIFNRWGELVFSRKDIQANDESAGWNGTYNGKQQTADTYVYTVEVLCDNNEVLFFKGDVTLLR